MAQFPTSAQPVRSNPANSSASNQLGQVNPLQGAPTLASHEKRAALKNAVETKNFLQLQSLFSTGALGDIDEMLTEEGETALSLASKNSAHKIVQFLLAKNAGQGGNFTASLSLATALNNAAKNNDEAMMNVIIRSRTDDVPQALTLLEPESSYSLENDEAYKKLCSKLSGSTVQSHVPPAGQSIVTTTTTATTAPAAALAAATNVSTGPADNYPHPSLTDDEIQAMFNNAKNGMVNETKACLDRGMVAAKKSNSDQTVLSEAARKGQLAVVTLIVQHPSSARLGTAEKQRAINAADYLEQPDIARAIKKAILDSEKDVPQEKRTLKYANSSVCADELDPRLQAAAFLNPALRASAKKQ